MNSYLFLDIDGVLAHHGTPSRGGLFEMDSRNVVHLNRIVEDTRPEIVVTSTWRINHDTDTMRAELTEAGFEHSDLVIGATARIYAGDVPSIQLPESHMRRGVEIIHWLETFAKSPCGMVILDDEASMWVIKDRLVQITQGMFKGGLKAEHVEPAIRLLQTPLTKLPDSAVARLVYDPFVGDGRPTAVHVHRGAR